MNTSKMKSGFTMMELIFVIVIIAGLMAMFIPKITSNADKAEVSSVLSSDIKSILSKATEWKKMDSDSKGTFEGITTAKLAPYLPDNMSYDESGDYIKSSGYGGQVHYKIASDKINKEGDSVKVFVDASVIGGSARVRKSAEVTGMNILVKYSSNHAEATKGKTAKAVNIKDGAFDTTNGTVDDGKFGVGKIAQ